MLFRRYAGELLRGLRRRGLPYETAADLTQDTFVRIIGISDRLHDTDSNPRAYLHAISRNLAIDLVRRERLMPTVDLTEAAFNAVADPTPSAETIVFDRQRLKIVEIALAELPSDTRRTFELYRLGELTLAEVATEIGCSTSRAWRLVRDGYAHIRLRLNEAEGKNEASGSF